MSSKGRGKNARAATSSTIMEAYPTVADVAALPPTNPVLQSGSLEASEILQQTLQAFNMQNSQLGQMMTQVQRSLQELAQGQAQMVMLMRPASSPTRSTGSNMEEDRWSVTEPEMPNPNIMPDM